MVDGDLVVTDVNSRSLVWLDPADGHELQRESTVEPGDEVLVAEAAAGGAFIPAGSDAAPAPPRSVVVPGLTIVDGAIEGVAEGGATWTQPWAGERVLAVARSGDSGYAYVSTPGADGTAGGAVVEFDVDDGEPGWRRALPAEVAVQSGTPALGATPAAIVVAGGEHIAVLDPDDGNLRWRQSVVSLSKSRGYALPGAVQEIIVSGSRVFLSATPDS